MTPMQTQEKVEKFFQGNKTAQYKKGEIILQPDDPLLSIFYLRSGFVRMYTIDANGRELTVNIFKPGTYFPLFLAFQDAPNTYFFQTITPAATAKARKQDVMQFIQNNPDVLMDFTRRISIGFHGLLANIRYQLFGTVHQRITSTISVLVKRFGEQTSTGITITLPLTHQDIANLTGVARETASLELEKLQKQKVISYEHKHITILRMQVLEDEGSIEEPVEAINDM